MMVDNTLGIPNLVDEELLGSGGFSVVYSATHTVFDRRVAVKVLTSITTEADRRRFAQECRAMGRLSGNPNVVTVYQADYTTSNRPYLIMELVQGGSLADLLDHYGRLPWDRAVDIVLGVCGAVQHAHREGVLHRDIKPENILLDNGTPKLADFGIASLHDADRRASTQVSGSWFHTPPETFRQARDERSDLYALASTLYTAVRGHPPLWRNGDDSVYPLVQRLMTEDPPPLPPDHGPPELSRFLQRALARDPEQRPQTAPEFATGLAAIRGVTPPAVPAPAAPTTTATATASTILPQPPSTDTTGVPAPQATATQVMDDQLQAVAKAAQPARETGDLAPLAPPSQPRPRSRVTMALAAAGVVLLGAVSAAGTWMLLDRGEGTSSSATGTSAGKGSEPGGADAQTTSTAEPTTTTTLADADADGVPDADDACPDQAGAESALGCPDADGDGMADADDACPLDAGLASDTGCPVSEVTVELFRFHVVSDCDSGLFGGDGEFTLRATVTHNATGDETELINVGDSYDLGDGDEVEIGETASFAITHQPDSEFRVEFHSEEDDGLVEGRDERLGEGTATNLHQWVRPDGWTNLDPAGADAYTLVNGDDPGACQVQLDYRLTIQPRAS